MTEMTKKERDKAIGVLNELVERHESIREFARYINEDASDVIRWRSDQTKIKPRAVISMARIYGIHPFDLRCDLFPDNLKFVFERKN